MIRAPFAKSPKAYQPWLAFQPNWADVRVTGSDVGVTIGSWARLSCMQ
jgi:hypothetical protein